MQSAELTEKPTKATKPKVTPASKKGVVEITQSDKIVNSGTRRYYQKKYPTLFDGSDLSEDERYELLSPRMQEYFDYMYPKAGVLFITSKPGLAKSSVMKEIAFVMGYNYIDIRLSIADETDFGMPKIKEIEYLGDVVDVHTMTIPKWAFEANKRKTIVHFEELNRCSLQVRNACLGVLLERVIGFEFELNESVLMVASGNLGDDDGTDVEEFDAAMNNRLIHVKHDMPIDEWVREYARHNIHPLIVNFLENKPELLNRQGGGVNGELPKAYPSQRTWFNLSEHILHKTKDREKQLSGQFSDKMEDIKDLIAKRGMNFVGTTVQSFIKFIDETMRLSLDNIIYDFNKYENAIKNSNRDKKSELLNQLRAMDLQKIDTIKHPYAVPNIIKFMEILDADEIAMYVKEMIRNHSNTKLEVQEPYKTVAKHFSKVMGRIKTTLESK